jgi:hypothetical protein
MQRTTPDLSGIRLLPLETLLTTDHESFVAQAIVDGSGSLDALPVTLSLEGLGSIQSIIDLTDSTGSASAAIGGWTAPGVGVLTASVVDPTDGTIFEASQEVIVEEGSDDIQTNDDVNGASSLFAGSDIVGSVGGDDAVDFFRIELIQDSKLLIDFGGFGQMPGGLKLSIISEDGVELASLTPETSLENFEVSIPAGKHFLKVEGGSEPKPYLLTYERHQQPPTLTEVIPANGPAGTEVTIRGSGFSIDPDQNLVTISGILCQIISASSSEIRVLVPAGAVSGELQMIVGVEELEGPFFDTGIPGPPQEPFVALPDLGAMVEDPVKMRK